MRVGVKGRGMSADPSRVALTLPVRAAIAGLLLMGSGMAFSRDVAPRVRLMDYFYPANRLATWIYLTPKEDGGNKATRVKVLDPSKQLTLYDERGGQVVSHYRRVMWIGIWDGVYSEDNSSFHPTRMANYEYFGNQSNYAIYGSDDFRAGMDFRLGPGAVFPERFRKGQMVSVNTVLFDGGGARGPNADVSVRFLGRESLTVPAGLFKDCIHLQFSMKIAGAPKQEAEEWWAKGVGVIQTKTRKAKGGFTTTSLAAYKIPFEPTVAFYKARSDFGSTRASNGQWVEPGITKIFRVRNEGDKVVRGMKISIVGSSVFTCLDPEVVPLAPGEIGEFRVHFNPNEGGKFNAKIKAEEIGNPENCSYKFITGTGYF